MWNVHKLPPINWHFRNGTSSTARSCALFTPKNRNILYNFTNYIENTSAKFSPSFTHSKHALYTRTYVRVKRDPLKDPKLWTTFSALIQIYFACNAFKVLEKGRKKSHDIKSKLPSLPTPSARSIFAREWTKGGWARTYVHEKIHRLITAEVLVILITRADALTSRNIRVEKGPMDDIYI